MDLKTDELEYLRKLVKADLINYVKPKDNRVGYEVMVGFRKKVLQKLNKKLS